jgi:hypothetical protein
MGPDERDRAKSRSDEPDVEAHRAKSAVDEGLKEPEDKASDDEPDVEAHAHSRRA